MMTEPHGNAGKAQNPPVLRYFDEILAVEHEAINERRARRSKSDRKDIEDRREIGPPRPLPGEALKEPKPISQAESKDPPPDDPRDVRLGGDLPPDPSRTRPPPYPRDLTGLALSGGGIRSAAFCLGGLQALEVHGAIDGLDYLSTVSGGGYIGASMTVGMSTARTFPFQRPGDPRDTASVGHIRNYSNYLMPRATSGLINFANVAVILLRGILANLVLVAAVVVGLAWLTMHAYRTRDSLWEGSFVSSLLGLNQVVWPHPFRLTLACVAALLFVLLAWVLYRSSFVWLATLEARGHVQVPKDSDTRSPLLNAATVLFLACIVLAILDLQPLLIAWLDELYARLAQFPVSVAYLKPTLAAATAFVSAVVWFSGRLGQFLKASEHAQGWGTFALRLATTAALWFAALLVPLLLLAIYLHLSAWGIAGLEHVPRPPEMVVDACLWAFWPALVVGYCFKPNAYSLHQLYRDRLSKAFLFHPCDPENAPLDGFKLSKIDNQETPYHIINAAMNVQGSLAANQRGREADFFTFTRDFVGSDLTLYASTLERTYANTSDMEKADPMIDVATAMAISGAALSANMGSNTIRPLSPTLALLNVRLGYWLKNPRHLAKPRGRRSPRARRQSLRDAIHLVSSRFYLLLEMFNLLDERRPSIYLSDGGHIENIGIYQLLKRGCQLIIAIDAECDPSLSFGSLIKAERFARIDLGIRIDLPWQQIAATHANWRNGSSNGPHCAVGKILYRDGSEGVLLYVKSCLTGDETDYVLDYQRRNPRFPHETTGDQFFTEDQFEAYRALGFHSVDRVLSGADTFALSAELMGRGVTQASMLAWIKQMVCIAPRP